MALQRISLAFAALCSAIGMEQQVSRVGVDVLGPNGEFRVYDKMQDVRLATHVVMVALFEVDVDGNVVGAWNAVDHSINTFVGDRSFMLLPAGTAQLGDTLNAKRTSFSYWVSNRSVGSITIDTYVLTKSGTAGPPGEEWSVEQNDVVWSLKLSNWSWCGCVSNGTNETGSFVDVIVSVERPGTAERGELDTTIRWAGVQLGLSEYINVDGKWQAMPSGHPKVTARDSTARLKFRFPKFNVSAVYEARFAGLLSNPWATSGTLQHSLLVLSGPIAFWLLVL